MNAQPFSTGMGDLPGKLATRIDSSGQPVVASLAQWVASCASAQQTSGAPVLRQAAALLVEPPPSSLTAAACWLTQACRGKLYTPYK
jgi:hypothetical protein